VDYPEYGKTPRFIPTEELDIERFLEESRKRERGRIEKELDHIDDLLSERERIHREQIQQLQSKLEMYIDRLEKLYLRDTGKRGGERDRLKQRIENLYRSIREEQRSHWLDRQDLEENRREIFRELEELEDSFLDLI